MLDSLQAVLARMNPPAHAHVGEAYLLHQTMLAYYYLRAKCVLFAGNCQSPELKDWYHQALAATEARIDTLERLMERLGVPLPATIPVSQHLNDQFMALDGAAMVKGMLSADAIMLQSTSRADIGSEFMQMFTSALGFGAKLVPIMEREGWFVTPPTYPSETAHAGH